MNDDEPTPQLVQLDETTIHRLAEQVAQLLHQHDDPEQEHRSETPGGGRLLSAAQVADWWGLDRSWVYAHADELGAHRLGTGPRPRLRFDPNEVRARLTQPQPQPVREPPVADRRRSRPRRTDPELLLPYRPDTELSSTSPSERRHQTPHPAPPTRRRSR